MIPEISRFLKSHNWKIIEEKTTWAERFISAVVQTPQGNFFLKATNPKTDLRAEIETEVWWNLTLKKIVAQLSRERKIFRPPAVWGYGREEKFSWYLGEYFAGPLLADWKDPNCRKPLKEELENLAEILVTLDQVRLENIPGTALYSEEGESSPYNQLLKKVDGWLEKPLEVGMITTQRVQQGKKLVEKYRPYVKPALQHGDFVPWHMFRLDSKTIGIVDGEHASLVKPRFYDLAYLYTRLYTKAHSDDFARGLLKMFLEKRKLTKEEFFSQFLPVLALRSFGMHVDSLKDKDYSEKAQDLLSLCFEEKLASFL